MNIFRRLALSRLLLLCAVIVAVGIGATALASALGSGPTPPARPLAVAVHEALSGPSVEGASARISFSNHLLEGASLASGGGGGEGGGIASNPLINGASGRLWITRDGRMRIELQSERGDTQILYDGHTLSLYDASANKLYRYTPTTEPGTGDAHSDTGTHEPPSVAKIEEALGRLRKHVDVSAASPTDVAGRPAYTVRVSPKEGGSLIGGAELSFDAAHGIPLRTAIYSSKSSSPVIELAATEISYGPVDSSVFSFSAPANATVEQIEAPRREASGGSAQPGHHGTFTQHGDGVTSIGMLETQARDSGRTPPSLEQLPKVKIGSTSASELSTELGTILTFERSGVRYVVAGAVEAAQVEALARSL